MIFGQRNFIIPAMVIIVCMLFCVRHKYEGSVKNTDVIESTCKIETIDKILNERSAD